MYSQYYNFMYNTRMVSEEDAPKSYEDLLDPKWKGKIGMSNRSYIWYMGIMDLMGREFFVFTNASSGNINVLYKRTDGNFGLIEPIK